MATLIKTAVVEKKWKEVEKLLRERNYNREDIEEFITSCEAADQFYVNDDTVAHFSLDQLNRLIIAAVEKRQWRAAGVMLKFCEDRDKRDWIFEHARKWHVVDTDFVCYILPNYNNDQLESALVNLVTLRKWTYVGKVLKRGVSDTYRRWAVDEAIKSADDWEFESYILPYCSDDQLKSVLKEFVTLGMWRSVRKVLERGVSDTHRRWAVDEATKSFGDWYFEPYLPYCSDDQLKYALNELITRGMWKSVGKVFERSVSDTQYGWVIEEICTRAHDDVLNLYILPHFSDDQLKSAIPYLVKRHMLKSLQSVTARGETQLGLMFSEMCRINTYNYTSVAEHIKKLQKLDVQLLIRYLSSTTEEKQVALRIALHQNNWDVVRKATLSYVPEQVRRELFRAAVEQRRWSVVKRWADHTVYDNQRWWAQEEAYREKQWDVMLLLTDYGMTDIELMRVRYRLAKYADWGVVVKMIERGVDVTEVREVVESAMISRKTARDKAKRRAMEVRWWQLRQLEDQYNLAASGRVRKWSLVLFYLHRHRRQVNLQKLLQRAIKNEAWRVVRHLLRLGLDTAQLDSLLTDMISRRKWTVCRVLLEQTISVQSCLEALPVLMDSDQWTLVARMMEFNVGDGWRKRVMRRAMERREGSVVWRCISTMQHYRLSVEEREELFQQAMSGGVWEVVKQLMEEKDSTGLRHRDTALLEAIEQRQWDVVDYCQWQGADINMKDNQGQTPLNRTGIQRDWKAVKELVTRGGDPNVPDYNNCCILNTTIVVEQWDLAQLIIEYHGNIHVGGSFFSTPLQFLIDKHQGEIIHHTLMWCPDQSKAVNYEGETTLHAMALDKRPDFLYHQIVRGVNPLTLTKYGQSVLQYAVKNPHCAQRMVAQCIKLGFGTHQPQFNVQITMEKLCNEIFLYIQHVVYRGNRQEHNGTSPLLCAVIRGLHVVATMLYESGCCSYTQLLQMYTQLDDFSGLLPVHGRGLLDAISRIPQRRQAEFITECDRIRNNIATFLPYLREMATTPRSLVSTCRLVISHHLVVRGRRERDVQHLPLTNRMKNYLLFSDVTAPNYARYQRRTLTSEKCVRE